MKKATRKKLLDAAITVVLAAALVVVVYFRFGPGKHILHPAPPEPRWVELPAVATVEVASDLEALKTGLMWRPSLPRDSGMYFRYDKNQVLSFWMKNTRIPLSIAYIRNDGTIATIKDMKPFDETKVSSDTVVRDALEMNRGWFDENDVRTGDKAELKDNQVRFFRLTR